MMIVLLYEPVECSESNCTMTNNVPAIAAVARRHVCTTTVAVQRVETNRNDTSESIVNAVLTDGGLVGLGSLNLHGHY